MNLDYKKVKDLILAFGELDEEYQHKLLVEAYKLNLMQSQKDFLKKEQPQFKDKDQFQKEVEKRASERAKDIIDIMDKYDQLSDTAKASFLMVVHQLEGKGTSVQEPEISITIESKNVPMKEYLEKNFFDVDYDETKQKAKNFMEEYEQKLEK